MSLDIFDQLKIVRKAKLARKSWFERTRTLLKKYVESHPLQTQPGARLIRQRTAGVSIVSSFRPFLRSLPAVLTIIVIIMGTVSAAANSSIPGDFLYDWKLKVNEPIKLTLAFNDQARAQYSVDLVNERLNEITNLSVSPAIPLNLSDLARRQLEVQVKKAEDVINVLGDKDSQAAFDTTVRLHAVLAANQKVLTHLESSASNETKDQIRQTVNTVAMAQINAEDKTTQLSTKTAQEAPRNELKTQTDKALNNAVKAVSLATKATNSATITDNLAQQAKSKLSTAQNRLAAARKLYAVGKYSEAYVESRNALQFATDAKAIIDIAQNASPEVKQKIAESDKQPPAITSIAPQTAVVNYEITINGSGFAATGNIVKIGLGYVLNVASPDNSTLTFALPKELPLCPTAIDKCPLDVANLRVVLLPGKYEVSVTNDKGTSQTQSLIIGTTQAAVPKITNIAPSSLSIGTEVTITGSNFAATGNTVIFGNGYIDNLPAKDFTTITFSVPSSISVDCGSDPSCNKKMSLVAGSYALSVSNKYGTSTASSVIIVPVKISPEAKPSDNEEGASLTEPSATLTPNASPATSKLALAPHILKIDKIKAGVGDNITLSGSGYALTDNKIRFGDIVISDVASPDQKTITFSVPQFSGNNQNTAPGTYKITIDNGFSLSNAVDLEIVN